MMGRLRIPAVVVVLWLALGGCSADGNPPEQPNVAAETETTRSKVPGECEYAVIVEHAFSASDDTDLVGFADNVFVGRVKERFVERLYELTAQVGGARRDVRRGRRRLSCATWIPAPI